MKKLKVWGPIVGILACIVGVYLYLSENRGLEVNLKKNDPVAAKEAQTKIDKRFETPLASKVTEKYETMRNAELIQEVHNMTHQKVEADKKWGSSEITADKVQTLFNVIKNRDFQNGSTKDMLLAILEPWIRKDFTNAVNAHNRIWSFQNGNIGKATRLLTPQEELEYIEDQFR